MSGISSGIGLISGIDTASLIDQLIAIERRPVETLQARVTAIDVQRAAFLELSAQLLAVQNTITNFGRPSFFRQFNSVSSDETSLTAEASNNASPGTHSFRVRSLVSTHALISRGFADADTTPIGVGTLRLESALAKVNRSTQLDALNGGAGVRRGVVTITDRSGTSADIDLSTALTVSDVLDAINTNTDINIRAYVTGVSSNGASGDRIVIEDRTETDAVVGNLTIADADGGFTATDLGIVADATGSRIDGRDLLRLSAQTPLSLLNDGNGVGRFRADTDIEFSTGLGDFSVSLSRLIVDRLDTDLRILNSGNGVRLGTIRITDRSGQSAEIDLSQARTVQDVKDAINGAGTNISAEVVGVNNDTRFQLLDSSTVPDFLEEGDDDLRPKFIVEDLTGSTAADLGIAQTVVDGDIQGSSIYHMDTVGDVINAINFAQDNNSLVEAAISADGNGITLRALGLNNTVTVAAGTTADGAVSTAAYDLGLLGADHAASFETRRLVGGLDTVLLQTLNGGRGMQLGEVALTDRAGNTTTIDFSIAHTLQDVVDLINLEGGTSLRASINAAGNGIMLEDESGGVGGITIEDVTGSTAAGLGIAGTFTDATVVAGTNLNRQYISRQSLLADFNNGRGVAAGAFTITDSNGAVTVINIDDRMTTVGEIVDSINGSTPDTISARINDGGDGIVVVDTSGGSKAMKIEDVDGGKTAADLQLSKTAKTGENFIDGSFEVRVSVDASDTLQDVVRKINETGADVTAAVVNHGGMLNPFSLTITSGTSGRAGEMLVGAEGIDLGFNTLSKAQDAIITVGGEGAANPRLVSSSTNTVTGVVPGVTLNLLSVSDAPVTVSISQDVDGITESIKTFVEKYNEAFDTIDKHTSFNDETLERGPLLGDAAVDRIRQRLVRLPLRAFEGVDASVSRLFQVGLRLGAGNRLEFDEDRFREVYDATPERVEQLFTEEETGFAAVFKNSLEDLTRNFDGVISRKDELLSDQQELLNGRIDSLNVLLDAKRARLEAQFVALESSLAALQGQQSALAALAQL